MPACVKTECVLSVQQSVGIYWTDKKETFGPFEAEVTDVDQREDFSAWTYQLTFQDEVTLKKT